MIDEEKIHLIDRSEKCFIIPNASDKPIELWMLHYNSIALIINKKTGDICTQSFYEGEFRAFDSSSVRKYQQDIFLEQEGEKFVLLFKTNYDSPNVSSYLSDLESRGIPSVVLTANVKSFPDFQDDRLRFGEFPIGFRIDLTNPKNIQVLGSDKHFGEVLTQELLSPTENYPSSLPEISKMVSEWYKYNNAANVISWAHDKLEEAFQENPIDFSRLSNSEGRIGQEVECILRLKKPFSSSYLYNDENGVNRIMETLSFVEKQEGMHPKFVAMLTGKAASEAGSKILNVDPEDPEFEHLSKHCLKLVEFAKSLLEKQPEEIDKITCADKMRDEFNRLHKILSKEMPQLVRFELPERPALPSGIGEKGSDGNLVQGIDQNEYRGI
jgi:hypothetical protein